MSVSKRTRITVVAVILLLSLAGVAAAANTVWFVHETDSDFQDADLDGMEVVGSGSSATVELIRPEIGSTATTGDHTAILNQPQRYGIIVEPKTGLSGVNVELDSDSAVTKLYLVENSTGSVLDSTDVSGLEGALRAEMNAGSHYRIVGDDDGSFVDHSRDGSPSFPYESSDIDIVSGRNPAGPIDSNLWNVREVTAVSGDEPEEGSYTHEWDITDPSQGFVDLSTVENMSVNISWERHDGSSWVSVTSRTETTAGNYSDSLSGSSDQWRVVVEGEATTGDSLEGWDFGIESEGIAFENEDPVLSNPSPTGGAFINSSPVTLSVDVTDSQFGFVQDDEVTVTFYDAADDSVIGSDTLTSNGTASTTFGDVQGGENKWYAQAADDWGGTDSIGNQTFETFEELEIRDEETLELINDSSEVTIRFFRENSEEVVTLNTSTGSVLMSDLPADDEFVVTASTDGYHNRRVLIDSFLEQQSIYLLNESSDSVFITFELDDRTGEFPSATTKLEILKALGENETSTFEVIAGDYFGASGGFPIDLRQGDRYRIRVTNAEDETRVLGAFTAEAEGTAPLVVGVIEWEVPSDEVYSWSFGEVETATGTALRFTYNDSTNSTMSISGTIYEAANESNELTTFNEAGPVGAFVFTTSDLTEDQQELDWEVSWEADRSGVEIGSTLISGLDRLGSSIPIASVFVDLDQDWKNAITLAVILGAGLVTGGIFSAIGALIVTGMAFVLWFVGLASWGTGLILLSLVGAVAYRLSDRTGGL